MTKNGKIWYFRFDDDNKLSYISSQSPTFEWASSTHKTAQIVKKIRKVIERINYILDTIIYILDTLRTEYTQQAFAHASGIFHCMWSMEVSKSAWWW